MTYDEFVDLALALPGTQEVLGKSGDSNVVRDDKSMFWLKKGVLLCIKLGWDEHDRLLDAHPGVLYKTPHFEGYPALHADLDALSVELAKEVIQLSWENTPVKVKYRRMPKL